MRILIIQDGPDAVGGLQTLLARFAGWLLKEGHDAWALVRSASSWRGLIPAGVNLVEAGDHLDQAYRLWSAHSFRRKLRFPEFDAVFHLEMQTAAISRCLFTGLVQPPSVLVCNFMPDLITSNFSPLSGSMGWLNKQFYWHVVQSRQRLFMSATQLNNLRRRFGSTLDGAILALPVDLTRYATVKRAPVPGRMVTVCRLDPMKVYVLPLIRTVKRLRASGYPATLEIHGEGVMRAEVEDLIASERLGEIVSLHGVLPYGRLPEVLAKAFVFVGMGTSLVEAAAAGVPSLVAFAHDSSGRTGGWFPNGPVGDLGDPRTGGQLNSFEDELRALFQLSAADYERMENRMRQFAQHYDCNSVFPKWLEVASVAGAIKGGALMAMGIGLINQLIHWRLRLRKGV